MNSRKLSFSSQILCVEGKTDKIFVQAIFEYMKKTMGMKSIPAHQIIVMNSNTLFQAVQSICESLNVKCVVLLDRDAIVKIRSTQQGKIIGEIRLTGIIKDESNLKKFEGKSLGKFESDENFVTLIKILEEKDIFIWKNGNLEETIGSVFIGGSFKANFQTDLYKKVICTFDKEKLSKLAKEMCKSDEIKRFLNFFKLKKRGEKPKK